MKKLTILLIAIFFVSFVKAQNQPPVAVNDTVSFEMPGYLTVNVINNDYDPDGDYIRVLGGQEIYSFTDSTITYLFDPDNYGAFTGHQTYEYVIEDEYGNTNNTSSVAEVYVELSNPGTEYLDINNINARFNSFGGHFYEYNYYGDNTCVYEYPKGSGKHTIFSNNLWIGGWDSYDQLRLGAERYRQVGTDFWTGPLSVDGNAFIDTAISYQWFKVWKLNKDEIIYHKFHWTEPGYTPIPNIAGWPAHGDQSLNQAEYLAPFVDADEDGVYDPLSGDYPLIRGDQALFFIFNDQREHTETEGLPIGLEIHGMAYAFSEPGKPELDNTTFLSYKIFNRSQNTLTDTYVGFFTDIDLGYAYDDFVGCDVSRGAAIGYNGDEIDGNGEPEAYGENPPAQGVIILGGPYIDADEEDNPDGECNESINGVGFGDGIIDNERYGMNHFIYFNNVGYPAMTDPYFYYEYYNYLKGVWKDSTVMEYGANGHVSGGAYGPACNFMFPGLSDPCYWGTGGTEPFGPVDWTEETAGNIPYDRRGLISMGPFTFEAGGFHKVDIAFTTARGDSTNSSMDLLLSYIDSVRTYYHENPDYFGYTWLGSGENMIMAKKELFIYPNPVTSILYIKSENNNGKTRYMIYNVYGRLVASGHLSDKNNNSIDVTGLKQGVYVLKVVNDNNIQTKKFLKK